MKKLRDYQANDVAKIREAIARGVRRILYVLPTGGGKTVVFCDIAASASAKGKRTGILAHRQELLSQCSRSLRSNGIGHGLIAPGHTPNNEVVQIASVQTLVRRLKINAPFRILIVDEAHHSTAGSWQKIFAENPDAIILGVTATPCRLNGAGLGDVFQEMIIGPSISQLMDEGYLCRARVFSPPPSFSFDDIKMRGGDYAADEIVRRVDKPQIIGDTVAHYKKLCSNQPALDFCCSIAHAEHSAEKFKAAGFRWRVLSGDMSDDYRAESIAMLASGDLDGISSCDIVSEGTDIPVASVCIQQRPTESLGLHMQQIGRVLRPIYADGFDLETVEGRLAAIAAGPKPFAVVLDHVNNTKHGLPDKERLWSLAGLKKTPKREARYQEEQDITLRRCPECFHSHKPAARCPNPDCNHEYTTIGRLLDVVPGTLVEQTREKLEALMASYRSLSEFKKIAAREGHNPVWANIAFAKQSEAIRACRDEITAAPPAPFVITLGNPEPVMPLEGLLAAQEYQGPQDLFGARQKFSQPGRSHGIN